MEEYRMNQIKNISHLPKASFELLNKTTKPVANLTKPFQGKPYQAAHIYLQDDTDSIHFHPEIFQTNEIG